MKNRMITTMLVAASALLALADAASAYYSPNLGRFLNRDPINEQGAVLLRTVARDRSQFIPRDPIDKNGYTGLQNNAIDWFDPDGGEPTTQPTSQPTAQPAGTNCGIDMLQVPFCLCGGGNAGHTWLTWDGGGQGKTADLPSDYIQKEHKCEAENPAFINNKWHTVTRSNGSLWGTQKKCPEATCDDIKACLRNYMGNKKDAFRWYYNCRNFADDAVNRCCLRKTGLQVNWDAPSVYCRSNCSKIKT